MEIVLVGELALPQDPSLPRAQDRDDIGQQAQAVVRRHDGEADEVTEESGDEQVLRGGPHLQEMLDHIVGGEAVEELLERLTPGPPAFPQLRQGKRHAACPRRIFPPGPDPNRRAQSQPIISKTTHMGQGDVHPPPLRPVPGPVAGLRGLPVFSPSRRRGGGGAAALQPHFSRKVPASGDLTFQEAGRFKLLVERSRGRER